MVRTAVESDLMTRVGAVAMLLPGRARRSDGLAAASCASLASGAAVVRESDAAERNVAIARAWIAARNFHYAGSPCSNRMQRERSDGAHPPTSRDRVASIA